MEKEDAEVGGIRLPVFDKSLFGGQGDRLPSAGPLIQPPLDVVLFEGWCVGFCPTSPASIASKFNEPIPDLEGILNLKSFCRIEDILEINEKLKLTPFTTEFKFQMVAVMILDYVGCWIVEKVLKALFSDIKAKDIAVRRPDQLEREEKRRQAEKEAEDRKKEIEAGKA